MFFPETSPNISAEGCCMAPISLIFLVLEEGGGEVLAVLYGHSAEGQVLLHHLKQIKIFSSLWKKKKSSSLAAN